MDVVQKAQVEKNLIDVICIFLSSQYEMILCEPHEP